MLQFLQEYSDEFTGHLDDYQSTAVQYFLEFLAQIHMEKYCHCAI